MAHAVSLTQVLALEVGTSLHGVTHVRKPTSQLPGLVRLSAMEEEGEAEEKGEGEAEEKGEGEEKGAENGSVVKEAARLDYRTACRGYQGQATTIELTLASTEKLNYDIEVFDRRAIVNLRNLHCRTMHLCVGNVDMSGVIEVQELHAVAFLVEGAMIDLRAETVVLKARNLSLADGDMYAQTAMMRAMFLTLQCSVHRLPDPRESRLFLYGDVVANLQSWIDVDVVHLAALFLAGRVFAQTRSWNLDVVLNVIVMCVFCMEGLRTSLIDQSCAVYLPSWRAMTWWGLMMNAGPMAVAFCWPLKAISLSVQAYDWVNKARQCGETWDPYVISQMADLVHLLCGAYRMQALAEGVQLALARGDLSSLFLSLKAGDWASLLKDGILGRDNLTVSMNPLGVAWSLV
jgi:hypothetical protein